MTEGREFFDEFWPEARAVSDPKGEIFSAMGVSRASLRQIFGPGVWVKALQAMKKGYRPGRAIGNPWLLPGIFLVENGSIRWQWRFKNIGDHPDFGALPGLARTGIGPTHALQ